LTLAAFRGVSICRRFSVATNQTGRAPICRRFAGHLRRAPFEKSQSNHKQKEEVFIMSEIIIKSIIAAWLLSPIAVAWALEGVRNGRREDA
jgi:hypothetical protein